MSEMARLVKRFCSKEDQAAYLRHLVFRFSRLRPEDCVFAPVLAAGKMLQARRLAREKNAELAGWLFEDEIRHLLDGGLQGPGYDTTAHERWGSHRIQVKTCSKGLGSWCWFVSHTTLNPKNGVAGIVARARDQYGEAFYVISIEAAEDLASKDNANRGQHRISVGKCKKYRVAYCDIPNAVKALSQKPYQQNEQIKMDLTGA